MRNILIPLIAALIALPLSAQGGHGHEHGHGEGQHTHDHGHEGWYADFDEAVKVAKKEKKDLLVDFTGSDWCGWCIRLNKEVFDHEEWSTEAKKSYVLVALDFPQDPAIKAKVPNPKRNDELQKKYSVSGFPTILLMTADGEVFGRTGYQAGGPKAYLKHMAELRTEGMKKLKVVRDLQASFKAAEGDAKDTVVGKAIETLGTMTSDTPGVGAVADIAKHGLESESMMESAVAALLKSGQADAGVYAKAEKLDPKNEKGLLERCVEAKAAGVRSEDDLKGAIEAIDALVAHGELKDKDLAQRLYTNAAYWNHQFLKNAEGAKKYAKLLEPFVEKNPRLQQLIDMINK